MTNNEAIGILAIVVETAKGRCFVTDEAISDAYAMAISALQEQEELYVYSQCKTCRYYHDDDDVRCMICDDENDMYEGQEAKTQLSREDTTLGVQKTCITCKHYPPESKWPCIDCDMRNPADRWEPQELSKNSTELDKENGDLQPTCNNLATDTISRQAICDYCHEDSDGYVTPLEKNCHAFVRRSPIDGWVLSMKYGAWRKDIPIRFCPMCGRRLKHG